MRTYIFGPVPSRRLGNSLGVDLTPTKTCSFNCLYCQLSETEECTTTRAEFCPPDDVINELIEVLKEVTAPDWITFSGTGEPTLHSGLGYILKEIKKLNIAPTCVITNGSLFDREDVREDLLFADRILPTLTTVNPETYKKIHRHQSNIDLNKILEGYKLLLSKFKGETEIEIFVCPGINDTDKEISDLSNFLKELGDNLNSVYLNTAVRDPLDSFITTASQEALDAYRKKLNLSIPVKTAFEHSSVPVQKTQRTKAATESDVLKLLLRHPCSQIQLETVLQISSEKLKKILCDLQADEKIKKNPNGDWALKNKN